MTRNHLSPINFKLSIGRLPNVNYTVQEAILPSIQMTYPIVNTPFTNLPQTGKLIWNPLQLTFLVDESMTNYKELYNWMIGMGFPEKHEQYKSYKKSVDEKSMMSLLNLQIQNSNKKTNISIDYYDAFPVSLSDIPLDVTAVDVNYAKATATFEYSYFKIN